jgi:CheY-like chemotaxis protein
MGEMRNSQLKGVKVLLVDDNEDSRYVLMSYLVHFGATVVTARSGGEALALAGTTRCHVIVSDLSMPGITGGEFLRRLRALPGQFENATPAIAVTAFDDRAARQGARDDGFSVYLTKPVDPTVVVHEVERVFRESQEHVLDDART